MKLIDLLRSYKGRYTLIGDENVDIRSIESDSRKIESGAMFFCVSGQMFDAHEFAGQAIESGAVALIVERRLNYPCAQVVVDDVRDAMSYIAAEFFGNPAKHVKMIGLTGTKGKTTTSFLIKSILEEAGYKTGLIGTICSSIGETEIPSNLTTPDPIEFQGLLRKMVDAGAEFIVMEVSAHAIAFRRVEGVFFEAACFLNLSQDHLDFFGSMENYLAAKMKLFTKDKCAFAIYNADDDVVRKAFEDVELPKESIGIRVASDVYANDIEIGEMGCSYRLTVEKRYKLSIDLRLSGIFNVYNSMIAAAVCDKLNIDKDAIKRGLVNVKNVPGRIELLETDTPYRVILDYAHSPDALSNILTTIRQTAKARVIALFGCGGDRDHEKRPIMGEIGGRLADFCILTSDNPRNEDPNEILNAIVQGIQKTPCEYIVIENRRNAIREALKMARAYDVVVLAGKGHETYQEIKGVKNPFDEKIVVQELLKEMESPAK